MAYTLGYSISVAFRSIIQTTLQTKKITTIHKMIKIIIIWDIKIMVIIHGILILDEN